ncbi:MAG: Dna2/Cas4 domain-containing protein [Pseudomonadota bacterium]
MLFRLFKNMLHAMIRKPRVISRDGLTLTDPALGLVGQPDRIEQLSNGQFIPFEKKSGATKVYQNIKLQLAAYMMLVESHFGVRPDFGWAVLRDDKRTKIKNTAKLQAAVRRTIAKIHSHRTDLSAPISVRPSLQQCQGCGFRTQCSQARSS